MYKGVNVLLSQNNLNYKRAKPGFTLVELMFVMVITAILGYVAVNKFSQWREAAKESSTKTNLRVLEQAITSYELTTNQYPQHLEDLIIKPASLTQAQWKESYLKDTSLPVDGWKNEFYYKLNPRGQRPPYILYSWGPNGDGSPDDEHISA